MMRYMVLGLVAAEGLGMPYLSPYLQSIGSDFRHGANFATSASTVVPPLSSYFVSGLSPFPLPVQLKQMKQFKAKVDEFHQHGTPKYVKFLVLLGILLTLHLFLSIVGTAYEF